MSTITARIPDDLNVALTKVAKLTERSKNHIIYKSKLRLGITGRYRGL